MFSENIFLAIFPFCFLIKSDNAQEYCAEKNARYATNQCDGYFECNNGVGDYKLCPDGLLFKPDLAFDSYPCVYPNEITCAGRNKIQEAQPTEHCPRQFAYLTMGDSSNCGQFVNCVNGDAHVLSCPIGLAFDESRAQCAWPDETSNCDAERYLGFRCPAEDSNLYAHERDCKKYFSCKTGRPRLHECGEGYYFDHDQQSCQKSTSSYNNCGSGEPFYKKNNFGSGEQFYKKDNLGSGEQFYKKDKLGSGEQFYKNDNLGSGEQFYKKDKLGSGEQFYKNDNLGSGEQFYNKDNFGSGEQFYKKDDIYDFPNPE